MQLIGTSLVKGYLAYKAHVCKQTYSDVSAWEAKRDQVEENWPEYKDSVVLNSTPSY